MLTILQKDKWQVKFSKRVFAQQKVAYLGHVSAEGVATDDSKIYTIKEWSTPTNLMELRDFFGLTGYYRKFIKHYAITASRGQLFRRKEWSINGRPTLNLPFTS